MGTEKLERVMWRIRKENPETNLIHFSQLRMAIMKEIGTDIRTYRSNKKALINLGWLKTHRKTMLKITDEDLTS